jgi:hypothetical protein
MSFGMTSSPPLWSQTVGTVSQIITAVGILTGGAFAYFKLLKGRAFRPRGELTIEPQIINLGGGLALHISVNILNSGQVSLLFTPEGHHRIYLSQIKASVWGDACDHLSLVAWEEYADNRPIGIALDEGRALEQCYQDEDPQSDADEAPKRIGGILAEKWGIDSFIGCQKVAPGESWMREVMIPIKRDTTACLIRVSATPCTHVTTWSAPIHKRRCLPRQKDSKGYSPGYGTQTPLFWKDTFITVHSREDASWPRVPRSDFQENLANARRRSNVAPSAGHSHNETQTENIVALIAGKVFRKRNSINDRQPSA